MSKNAKQILDGLGDRDPDLREMACRDLEKGLLHDLKPTSAEEQQLSNRFLEMMVKDQTLKVLASHTLVDLLSKSTNPSNVSAAVTQSVQQLLDNHEEDEKTIREVNTYALKGLITSTTFAPSLIHGPLLNALKDPKKNQITEYALDVIETLLVNWGNKLSEEEQQGDIVYETLQSVALPHLQSHNYNIQTKAIGCVGNVGAFLSFDAFEKLIGQLIGNLKLASTNADCSGACTTLNSLSTICRLSPGRFSKFLEPLVPLINVFVQASEFTDEGEQVKVCEAALTTFETIGSHCSNLSSDFYSNLQEQSLQFISYDPTVLEGEDYGDAAEVDDTGEFDYDDDGGVDETESWRVRKACIRCIHVVASKSELFTADFFDTVAEELLKRFTDSQINVKIEIFKTFASMVGLITKSDDSQFLTRFNEWIPTIVTALSKEFKSKGDRSKVEAFALVGEIAAASPGCFDDHISKLVPGIVFSLKDSSENVRAEASKAFRGLLQYSSNPATFHPHVKTLIPALIVAIGTPNFKVTSAALRAAGQLSHVLPNKETVEQIYNSVYPLLGQENTALEVKEASMGCCGQLIAAHADKLGTKANDCIKTIGDRLGHATTGVAASKAIQTIVLSPHKISLGNLAGTIAHQLLESLKLNNRQLRQAALESLTQFVTSTSIKLEGFDTLTVYMETDDLLIMGLALRVVTASIKANVNVVSDVIKHVVPKCLTLLKNPSLQGGAVTAMASAMKSIVDAKHDQFDSLLSSLQKLAPKEAGSQVNSIAQIIGAIVESHSKREEVVTKFLHEAKSGSPLAISVLGEIGSRVDVTNIAGVINVVIGSLGTSLTSSAGVTEKSVRYTAARALGSISVGNPQNVIPVLEKQISKTPNYVIAAIRQMFDRLSPEVIVTHTESLVKLLLNASEKADEIVRDSIADCLGKLAQVNTKVINTLEKASKSEFKGTRSCVVKAISLAINQSADYKIFAHALPTFLDGIGDKEVEVRTAALGVLQTCIAKNVSLVKSLIPKYEPLLSVETRKRLELITKVVVGNNTLVTDLGLPSRRTSFQIYDALLMAAPEKLNINNLITNLSHGTKFDEEVEIQFLCHKISVKLSGLYPEAILRGIGSFEIAPVFLKLLPNTAIDIDIKANEELVASAKTVINAVEELLCSQKYLNKADTYASLEALVKSGFGGLRCAKLYNKLIVPGLSDSTTQESSVKVLTELWRNFDLKLQNNIGHKAIAEDIISGIEDVLGAIKNLHESKNENYVKSTLAWIRIVELGFSKLERQRKDMKVVLTGGFNNFLNNTIKKGPLANKYAELIK